MSGKNGKLKKPDGRKISRRLTLKQRRFISEFTNPNSKGFGNQTKAAELAGYSALAPGQSGYRTLKNVEVQREIDRALDEEGATRNKVAQALHDGLEAKTTRVFCQDGQVIYSDPLEDHPTQVRAAEVVGKLRGDFPTNREQDRITGLVFQQNIVIVPPLRPEGERERRERLKNIRRLED